MYPNFRNLKDQEIYNKHEIPVTASISFKTDIILKTVKLDTYPNHAMFVLFLLNYFIGENSENRKKILSKLFRISEIRSFLVINIADSYLKKKTQWLYIIFFFKI